MYTSDVANADTNSDVSIQIYGPNGHTIEYDLDNRHRDDFERGHMDVFTVQVRDVGTPTKIRVKLTGKQNRWRAEKVNTTNLLI